MLRLPVTLNTPTHRQGFHLLYHRHVCDVAVTSLTALLAVFRIRQVQNVGGVIKLYEIRHHMHLHPLDGLTSEKLLLEMLNVGAVGLYDHVAVHAHVETGHSGVIGALHIGVTVGAGDLVLPCVNFMGEGNGLIRLIACVVVDVTPFQVTGRQRKKQNRQKQSNKNGTTMIHRHEYPFTVLNRLGLRNLGFTIR